MNLYIAVTFGPIGRVASYAEDTKGIWASSYFFVYLAKQVIKPMYEKRDFLLPQWSQAGSKDKEMQVFGPQQGAGLCPDRYIFKAEKGDFEELGGICDKVYRNTAKQIAEVIRKDSRLIEEYLKHTIKIYFCEHEFNEGTGEQEIVEKCGALLNAMECEDLFAPTEKQNYLKEFFSKVNGTFLTKDAYGETHNTNGSRLIKTIFEYSAGELKHEMDIDLIGIASGEKKMPDEVCTRHKYIAIVKADGDNMSKTLKAIYEDESRTIHYLDKQLLEYNLKVGQLIRDFGGVPIYTGGDDLLFFAPVVYNDKTIFQLLQNIDDTFNQYMGKVGSTTVPTLSFGLSVSYYKFPMFEATEMAEALLQKAKSDPQKKNRIIWSLRKHSGQTLNGTIDKNNPDFYQDVIKLIQESLGVTENEWLSSVAYWLRKEQDMLTGIISHENQLKAYIENNFNEDIHKKKKSLLDSVTEFLKTHLLVLSSEKDKKAVLDTLYSSLRFVLFMNGGER